MSGVLVVTGGSRGIGAAVCRLGAERGYAVCVNYVGQAARATEVVQAIQSRGGMAIAVQGDVSREDDVERLFGTVDRELGASRRWSTMRASVRGSAASRRSIPATSAERSR